MKKSARYKWPICLRDMDADSLTGSPRMPFALELEHGAFGSMWPVRPTPIRGGELKGQKWALNFVPGLPFLFLKCGNPELRCSADGHRRVVERHLDMMSWEGGGHYELDPMHARAEHLLWDWTADLPRVQSTLLLEHRLPFSMRSHRVDGPMEVPPTKHHPAMRYFRCAQVATNPVSAFQNLYLAFENLASERVAATFPNEITWLRNAITTVVATYPEPVRQQLPSEAVGELFVQTVYEAVRCNTFHAKHHRAPLAPFDEQEESVRKAYSLLLPHVVELLRSASGRPEGQRIPTESELADSGETLLDLEAVSFKVDPKAERTWGDYEGNVWSEGTSMKTWCISTRLDPALQRAVSGIRWRMGPMKPFHDFQVFPRSELAMDLEVRLVTRVRFDGLLRNPVSALDHIANLRSADDLAHQPLTPSGGGSDESGPSESREPTA